MTHQRILRFFRVVMFAILLLAACGPAPRPGDIEPVGDSPGQAITPPPPSIEATPTPASNEVLPSATMPPAETPDPQAELITFDISGGIVGFCDTLTVRGGGAYTLQSCAGETTTGVLEQADLDALHAWANELAAFQLSLPGNPAGPDNMITNLIFNGTGSGQADEAQQKMIFDWVNGLFIRLRPQSVEAPPTPTPPLIGPDGLCPNINRPALVIANYHDPNSLTLIDPDNQAQCEFLLDQPPFGRIMTAAGSIYYPVYDPAVQTVTIWRLGPNGEQIPLAFTTLKMEQFGPVTFALSGDGSKIAWARTLINPDVEPPTYRTDFWVANIDGSNQVTLMEQVENTDRRYVEPIRFSPDNNELFYALQPDGLGGPIFAFSGRYDTVYSVLVTGEPAQLIFACPTTENPICIGDVAATGNALTYAESGLVNIISRDGALLGALTPPAMDYVGPAVFGPTGNLAFVSATLSQPSGDELPLPNPGYIVFIEPPYAGPPQILLTDNSVAAVWEWVDENRLAYGSVDEFGNIGTSILTMDGQAVELSPNYALAVLR
ncbi:MAG: hypothetical protein JW953_11685 [Anaerolineae bacterium]|nr:hypothetical protein [Anaerolineae bacterium]